MGREIRRVPLNWEHPKYKDEGYIPLHNFSYEEAAEDYLKQFLSWQDGTHPDLKYDATLKEEFPYFWEYEEPPNKEKERFRPKWSEDNPPIGYQVYENVSEGTPVSPVFASVESLRDWLYAQGYSKPAIDNFIEHGYTTSLFITGGHIYYNIESCGGKK